MFSAIVRRRDSWNRALCPELYALVVLALVVPGVCFASDADNGKDDFVLLLSAGRPAISITTEDYVVPDNPFKDPYFVTQTETMHGCCVSFGGGSPKTQILLEIAKISKDIGHIYGQTLSGEGIPMTQRLSYLTIIPKLRRAIVPFLFGSVGFGMISRGTEAVVPIGYSYSGGGSTDIFPCWSWGVDVQVMQVFVGYQKYYMLGEGDHEAPNWKQDEFYLGCMFHID